ncbi:hypothetical protein [Burkholderia cenocepacia]|uniref:hypothetical protein n=1 Tax=Burkholderia cenocepacia TaxID=95486 RepID=UPI001B9FFF83|nr:hypothetical protein [Burkholderia cenocepacia]MBR8137173.1 hypothetical protein [Burkholderia cenocepacia]
MTKTRNDTALSRSGLVASFVTRCLDMVASSLTTWGGLARILILFLVLAPCFSIGYLVYSEQWRGIANFIGSKYGRYTMRSEAEVDQHATELLHVTGASSILVYSVFANQRRVIYMRVGSGRERRFDGVGDVLWPVGDHELLDDTARMMAGEIVCRDFVPRTVAGQYMSERGVTWACSVRAPHRHDGFAGIITLGFKERAKNSQYVRARLQDAADAITE